MKHELIELITSEQILVDLNDEHVFKTCRLSELRTESKTVVFFPDYLLQVQSQQQLINLLDLAIYVRNVSFFILVLVYLRRASIRLGFIERENKVVKITGVKHPGQTASLLVRGSNRLVLDETERSLHDALCVVRSLVKQRFLIAGGGAPEIEVALQLNHWAKTLTGMHAVCVRAFAEALEVIPYTLAENAGMNPIAIVTELRRRHAEGAHTAGINVRKSVISDILEENVVQPLLVSTSAITLATETVRLILKIDDSERRAGGGVGGVRGRAKGLRQPRWH